jgi:hypothetical protein
VPAVHDLARLVAVALEGAARGIRSEFLTPSRPIDSDDPPLIRAIAAAVAEDVVEDIAEDIAEPEPTTKPKRRVRHVPRSDRRLVVCSDGVARRWYGGHGYLTEMRRLHRAGAVVGVIQHSARLSLGYAVASKYFGEDNPTGILISDDERKLIRAAQIERAAKREAERAAKVAAT